MTTRHDLDERILGVLMGVGLGVLLGFFLKDRQVAPPGPR